MQGQRCWGIVGTPIRRRVGLAAVVAAALTGSLGVQAAPAQEPNQVTGVAVEQLDGFATAQLGSRRRGAGLPDRAHPGGRADNVPTGPAAITGLWRPNRTVTPAVADVRGRRLQPRRPLPVARARPVRHHRAAVLGAAVRDDAAAVGRPGVPGENLRTQWETTQAAQFTSDVERVRVHRRARRGQRPRAGRRDRPHPARTARSTCSSSATRSRRAPPGRSPTRPRGAGQLQRARQRAVVA